MPILSEYVTICFASVPKILYKLMEEGQNMFDSGPAWSKKRLGFNLLNKTPTYIFK